VAGEVERGGIVDDYRVVLRQIEEGPIEGLGPRMKEAHAARDEAERRWAEGKRPRRGELKARYEAAKDASHGLTTVYGILSEAEPVAGRSVSEVRESLKAAGLLSAEEEQELDAALNQAAQGIAGKGLPFEYRGRYKEG
jgi:hypothetical protein